MLSLKTICECEVGISVRVMVRANYIVYVPLEDCWVFSDEQSLLKTAIICIDHFIMRIRMTRNLVTPVNDRSMGR